MKDVVPGVTNVLMYQSLTYSTAVAQHQRLFFCNWDQTMQMHDRKVTWKNTEVQSVKKSFPL